MWIKRIKTWIIFILATFTYRLVYLLIMFKYYWTDFVFIKERRFMNCEYGQLPFNCLSYDSVHLTKSNGLSHGSSSYQKWLWVQNLNQWDAYHVRNCPRGVMVKAMKCGIVVREFVLQSRYYVHFQANTLGKGMNPLILPPAMDK